MDIPAIQTLLQSFGFPVVCCIVLVYFIKTQYTDVKNLYQDMFERFEQIVKDNTEALAKVQEVIERSQANDT